jgi:dephospho-CoA kinase
MVLRVGLTGGIASGKTTVSDLFALHNVPIIDTDLVAREVVTPGSVGLKQVVDHFGQQVLSSENQLDRRALRDIVFSDPKQREVLEQILHPLIQSRTAQLLSEVEAGYVILVIPLLIEAKMSEWVDRILVVDVSEETQLQRLCLRDQVGVEQAKAVMSAQLSREERLAYADDIIENDSASLELLSQAVLELHQRYCQLSQTSLQPQTP